MHRKRFNRIACTAGLLLVELAPTAQAQTAAPSDEWQNDTVPVTADHSANVAVDVAHDASSTAPEREVVVESAPTSIASYSNDEVKPIARESFPMPAPIAQPERFAPPSVVEATAPTPRTTVALREPEREVSTRAQDLAPPKTPPVSSVAPPETIPLPQPERIAVKTASADNLLPPTPKLVATPNPAPIAPKVGGTFTTGPGVGYSSSFTAVKGFVPIQQQPGQNITFAEGQAIIDTGNGNPSANLVLGHRFVDSRSDRIYGGYLAYDHRNTGKNGFNQLGLGFETLGKTWDARANVYLPIGNTRQLVSESTSSTTTLSNPFFTGNFLAANRTIQQQIDRRFEAAAAGVDIEAGGKITNLGETGELRGYGGLYYFGAPKGEGTIGWRTRLEARPNENLQVGLALSSDNNYGTNLALTVGVTFPTHGSSSKQKPSADPLFARLGDSVNRNAQIVLDRQHESSRTTIQDTALITNPTTGQPWRFRHAIPGVGTGDGTFENPTGTVAAALAVAQPDDIVYVQPGTNPGIPAFTIPDRVQVLSNGPIQRIDTVELGNTILPLSGAGVLPSVVGTVSLGNRTTLSGFAISTANGPGILGNNISQVTVRDNAIANTAAEGILLNNVQGQVAITDNTIQQSQAEGISLNNTQGQVDLLLTRNQITNNGVGAPDGDGVNLELRNNATGTFTITNNTIANNSGLGGIADGIDVKLFDAASGTFNLADNIITANQGSGVAIAQEATTQGTFNLARNTLSNNQLSGVDVLLSDAAQGQFNLDSNTLSNNQLNGIQAVIADQANGTINVTNNGINGNQIDGIFLQSSDQGRITANVLNNAVTNNLNNGIFTTANGTSQLRFFAQTNQITGNGSAGVSISNADSALTTAGLRSNTITGNTLDDVLVINTAPGTTCLQPLNNAIGTLTLDDNNNAAAPIQVEAGSLPTNTIGSSNTLDWSNTAVPAGACGF